jgi:GNAT superfamily N-acetyltransferase
MAEIEHLLLACAIVISPEPAGSATAKWCLRQYFDLLNERFEGGYNPANAQPADSKNFTPPAGIFLVARALNKPVGCGALKSGGPGIGEIKRLWVSQSARGLGIGQNLLTALENLAREFGMKTLRLDTNKTLSEAQALYTKNSYIEVPPFNDDPYPDHWFEKKLG